ncbi:hypothetical protein [Paraburkholderia caribensis]
MFRRRDETWPLPKAAMQRIFRALAEYAITAARLPDAAGGSGLSMLDYGLVFEQLPAVVTLALLALEGTINRLLSGGIHRSRPGLLEASISGRLLLARHRLSRLPDLPPRNPPPCVPC